MKRSDFYYNFPEELIAKHPLGDRSSSRLLVLNRKNKTTEHKIFSDIINEFSAGDVLVMNDSKVFPCRLITKRPSGGKQEILLLRKIDSIEAQKENWEILINANHKVRMGDQFDFSNLRVTITNNAQSDQSTRKALLEFKGNLLAILQSIGHIPLPPYLMRQDTPKDHSDYQTIYAKQTGSVAAPTAGLHFTQNILDALKSKGIIITTVTLHVGPGTFLPVRAESIDQHNMHSEFYSLPQETCNAIHAAKKQGKKITAVGTTSVRVLESAMNVSNNLSAHNGETNIFIYPPYSFKVVDRLITNFHQPESTLLMLVCAFAGHQLIMQTYTEAIANKYRLFSFGDAMLIK